MGLAVQWSDLKIINAVVKGVSDLIGSDSEGKAKSVEHLIVASEKLVSAVKYLDKQYIKAETKEEEQQLWELMEDLVVLLGNTIKLIDEFLADYKVKRGVSKDKLELLEDLRTAYKYLTGEISLNISGEELKKIKKEAKESGCVTWEELASELGLSE